MYRVGQKTGHSAFSCISIEKYQNNYTIFCTHQSQCILNMSINTRCKLENVQWIIIPLQIGDPRQWCYLASDV